MEKRALAAGVAIVLMATTLLAGGYNFATAETITFNRWTEVPVPGEGEDRGWVLA